MRALLSMIILFCSLLIIGAERPIGQSSTTRSEVIAQHGIAATSHPLATQIALDILKQGGNAIDAAIAANAALGLMEPQSCGIGGDLFALVWDAETKRLYGLNASGRSPRSLSIEYFREHNIATIPPFSPLSVSVPGAVDGWYELYERFGTLPMEEILAPAIAYAYDGFPVTEIIAYDWQQSALEVQDQPGFRETYMPGGRAPRKGEIFKNPNLAKTYQAIAQGGRDAFYKGEMARMIASFIQELGGFLSYEDLATHTSQWIEPVSSNYRGYDVWELPPNGQGIAALQILNILEGYDIQAMEPESVEYLHRFLEAKKLAFEDRARFYADPDFSALPVMGLISKDYAAQRRSLIDPDKASSSYPAGNPALYQGDTAYLTVADEQGNMVSLIQSNFYNMGSGLCPPGLGFVLQNRGLLFDLQDGRPNTYAPGKRPFHTIIPAFITRDGEPFISFGVMGGAVQPQMHVQIVVNLIDFGMNLQEAGDAPRIVHQGSSQPTGTRMTEGGTVHLEAGFPAETITALKELGHNVSTDPAFFGGYQAIMWDEAEKVYYGASESRKDGQAAGY
jgi:gamma-glutamyltranspeptidase/glutathione hydrolase